MKANEQILKETVGIWLEYSKEICVAMQAARADERESIEADKKQAAWEAWKKNNEIHCLETGNTFNESSSRMQFETWYKSLNPLTSQEDVKVEKKQASDSVTIMLGIKAIVFRGNFTPADPGKMYDSDGSGQPPEPAEFEIINIEGDIMALVELIDSAAAQHPKSSRLPFSVYDFLDGLVMKEIEVR